jgi:hypothetical protein
LKAAEMSIEMTRVFLREHAELRDNVEHFLVAARDLPDQGVSERVDTIERIVAFLADILLPHAIAEERLLYPQAARLLGRLDDSDSVALDRAAVRARLTQLAAADPRDVGILQQLLYALYTLLSAHFWREEGLYLDLVYLEPAAPVGDLFDQVRG